jgi:hypothetical protein
MRMAEETCTQHEAMFMKVALSVALLRMKPTETATRVFVEQLQSKYRQQECTWKERSLLKFRPVTS